MKLSVRIKPNSIDAEVLKENDNFYVVRVLSPARGDKANKEMVELLSEYFGVPKNSIGIASGLKSRDKIVDINQ